MSRTLLRYMMGTLALGALACSDHGANGLMQPDQPATRVTVAGANTLVVSLDPSTVSVGGSARATGTLRDSRGTILSGALIGWISSNPAVASVASTGIVTGVSPGTAFIGGRNGAVFDTASITVTSAPVSSVVVALGTPSLGAGGRTTATATLRDAAGNVLTGRKVTWSSSATSVATVSVSGDVLAIASGTARIQALSESILGHATVTVSGVAAVPVASVSISIPLQVLSPGQTTQGVATVKDAAGTVLTGRSVTWSSSAPSVASVSGTGLITGIGAGAASISAASEGITLSAPITVGPATIRSVTFDGYSNTAALLADCIVFDCIEQKLTDNAGVPGFVAGDVSLDDAANPPGATKAMRYHYVHPGDGCNSITLMHSIRFPARQEVWAEFVVKWSSSFTTRNDACIPNDHKVIFGDTQAAANGRWALYVGSDFGAFHTIKQEVAQSPDIVPGNYYLNKNVAPNEVFAEKLWNGTWHTIRLHMKASSSSVTRDGAYQIWIDGVLKHDQRGFATTRNDGTTNPDFIDGFSFARNQDDGPSGVDMYVWWGAIRVFGANPGW